ncbi:PAC2 family protein [Aeromicrobium sp. CTD01-1L150]|uniref:PAC2 family protein n=1 Tax=Aeromicrobium sp. CTD01-1L150 TaxID=3341830 RepID=UPI0035BF58A9
MEDVSIPPLNDPWMVAAFEGWNDAGDAASSLIDHLVLEWDAQVLAELDPDDYYDFQLTRPSLQRDDEGTAVVAWPTPTLFLARPSGFERDVLLLRAPEPNFRWRSFCSTLVGVARLAGVSELVTIGSLLTDAPHSRPVPISGTSSDPAMADRLSLRESRYEGPVGINAVLSETAAAEAIASASLWAAVPHYVAEPPCHKATLALLGALEDAVGCSLPQGMLRELAQAWQRGADEAAAEDPEIIEYVQELELAQDEDELPEASGESIAREFERYLKRRGGS